MKTKTKLHTESNQAFARLLEICLLLDLKIYYKALKRGRTFVSRAIDNSDLPVA